MASPLLKLQNMNEISSVHESSDSQWYVVYSKPRREEFARSHLCRKGLEVFFPRLALPHSRLRQNQIVPLFPNYLFVRLQLPEEYRYALWSPGVRTIVNFNGTPAPIDERVITFLKKEADMEGIIEGRSSLTVGQEVRIKGGPFDGLIGVIQNPPDARGRVNILMQLLNRQLKVSIPVQLVEDNWIIRSMEPAY